MQQFNAIDYYRIESAAFLFFFLVDLLLQQRCIGIYVLSYRNKLGKVSITD